MKDEREDGDPNMRSVRILPMYRTVLGDALFPSGDIFAMKLRSDFSEMLARHVESGGDLGLVAIGGALANFTPERVATTTHPAWKDRVVEEWENVERPQIFAALEAFFLDGGLQRRLEEQGKFFDALLGAGMQIENDLLLSFLAAHSGDWRKTFVDLVVKGREKGIGLSIEDLNRPAAEAAMRSAGFSREQQHAIWGSVEERVRPSPAPAWRSWLFRGRASSRVSKP